MFLTMYNEDENLFCRTFTSVVKNIAYLQSRKKSKTWGDGSWKKIVVCVVSDGRSKINPRTLKVLGLYGAFQEGVMKDTVDGKDVTAHLFEYTTQVSSLPQPQQSSVSPATDSTRAQVVVDKDGLVSGGVTPVQIMFLLKEQNKSAFALLIDWTVLTVSTIEKLNSHRWCFNAFCPQLQPNVCILLDVGTRPSGDSIYSLWKAFDKNKSIGGACGEITVDTGRGCGNLLNVLVAAQNFVRPSFRLVTIRPRSLIPMLHPQEYKMSNILDKPLESVFGYIAVLRQFSSALLSRVSLTLVSAAGAFSAYRYKALLGVPLKVCHQRFESSISLSSFASQSHAD